MDLCNLALENLGWGFAGHMCQNKRMHTTERALTPSARRGRILLLGCFVLVAGCAQGSSGSPAGGAGGKTQTGVEVGANGTGGSTATAASGGSIPSAGAGGSAGSTGEGGGGAGGAPGAGCGGACGGSGAAVDAPVACIGPTVSEDPTLRNPAPRPDAAASSCGAWALTDGVCCAQYCSNDDKSEDCSSCGGPGSPQCTVVNSRACTSGRWPEVHCVSDNEPWHYSRSTHFGLTSGGACAFGLYGLCTTSFNFTDPTLGKLCTTWS